MMQSIVLISFSFVLIASSGASIAVISPDPAASPQVQSSTYQIKETNLQGLQQTHAILKLDLDQGPRGIPAHSCFTPQIFTTSMIQYVAATAISHSVERRGLRLLMRRATRS